jgi:hypothetical protein
LIPVCHRGDDGSGSAKSTGSLRPPIMEPHPLLRSEEVPLTTGTSGYGVPLESTLTLVDSGLPDETGKRHSTRRGDHLEAQSDSSFHRHHIDIGDVGLSRAAINTFWRRLKGEGRRVPTWSESFKAIVTNSCLQIFYTSLSRLLSQLTVVYRAQRSPRICAPRMDSSFLEVVAFRDLYMWVLSLLPYLLVGLITCLTRF